MVKYTFLFIRQFNLCISIIFKLYFVSSVTNDSETPVLYKSERWITKNPSNSEAFAEFYNTDIIWWKIISHICNWSTTLVSCLWIIFTSTLHIWMLSHILPKEVLCSRKLLFVSIKCSYFWLDTSKTLIEINIPVFFTWTASSVDKLHSESLRCSCIHLGSLLRLSARENLYNKCTLLISVKLHCPYTTRD